MHRMLMHCVLHYQLPLFFLSRSLTQLHLPQCWTASNGAWWLKEMSVHSLIIPPSTVVPTVLIQAYRGSWNCSLAVAHGTLLRFVCLMWVCVCVCVHTMCLGVFNLLLVLLLFCGFAINRLCSDTREGNSFSQLVSHSRPLSLTLPFSLSLFPSSSLPLFLILLRGMATAGQTSRQGYAWGSPMQLADSEVQ